MHKVFLLNTECGRYSNNIHWYYYLLPFDPMKSDDNWKYEALFGHHRRLESYPL
jgi:hypothetical protein